MLCSSSTFRAAPACLGSPPATCWACWCVPLQLQLRMCTVLRHRNTRSAAATAGGRDLPEACVRQQLPFPVLRGCHGRQRGPVRHRTRVCSCSALHLVYRADCSADCSWACAAVSPDRQCGERSLRRAVPHRVSPFCYAASKRAPLLTGVCPHAEQLSSPTALRQTLQVRYPA